MRATERTVEERGLAEDVESCSSDNCTRIAVRFIGEQGIPFCEPCYERELMPEWATVDVRENTATLLSSLRAERNTLRAALDAARERVGALEAGIRSEAAYIDRAHIDNLRALGIKRRLLSLLATPSEAAHTDKGGEDGDD